MSIVEVRPLPIEKWHKKEGKESFTQPKASQVLYNTTTGRYDTGLTQEEAEEWGKQLGVDLSDRFNPNEEHPTWSSKAYQIRLENKTVFLDTSKLMEKVKVRNMKASKFVANSMREWEEKKWPDATHVIFDEADEADIKVTKIQKRRDATRLADKMTPEEKASMVHILAGKFVRGRSLNFVEVALDEAIEEHTDMFLRYAQMDAKQILVRGQVLEALHRQVLNQEGGSIYYMGERIGFDMEEAVVWFASPDNQKLKIAILEKLMR